MYSRRPLADAPPRAYYARDNVQLYVGDCREILPLLAPWLRRSVCITDPPYQQTSLPWDQWQTGWVATVPTQTLWSFGTLRMFLKYGAEFTDAGWTFAQDVVWEKHNGSSFHRDRFRRVHEQVAHFYKGAWSAQVTQVPTTLDAKAKFVRRRKQRPTHYGAIKNSQYTSIDGGPRLRRSVLAIRSCHGRALHPTEKPVDLLRLLVQYSSRPGQIIVDPFAGSGSLLEAALVEGRQAIGIERSPEDCARVVARIERVRAELARV